MNERNANIIDDNVQDHNRLIRAAVYVAQAALLIEQERREVISHRDVSRLGDLALGLRDLINPLERLGRAKHPQLISRILSSNPIRFRTARPRNPPRPKFGC